MRFVRNAGIASVIVIAVVATVPGPVSAAKPKPGGYVVNGSGLTLLLEVPKNRKKVSVRYYFSCSAAPVQLKAKINKKRGKQNGKFSFNGKVTNQFDQKVKVVLKGKFVTKKKAKLTIQASVESCKGDKEHFVSKFSPNY